jgi:hypothetical protein
LILLIGSVSLLLLIMVKKSPTGELIVEGSALQIIWAANIYPVEEMPPFLPEESFLLRLLPCDRQCRWIVRLWYLSLCLICASSLVFGMSSLIQIEASIRPS